MSGDADLGADLHPIASAVLRFYLGATHGVPEERFLDDIFELVRRITPEAVVEVGDDLLIVCRFFEAEGRPDDATAIAKRVDAAAQHATQRAGATAALNSVEVTGERFVRFADRPIPSDQTPRSASSRAGADARPDAPLERQWDDMSDRAKGRLRALAEKFLPEGD